MTDATPLASEQITQADKVAAEVLVAAHCAEWRWPELHIDQVAEYWLAVEAAATGIAFARATALSATPAPSDQDASQAQGEVWQHVKRGTRYAVLGTATLQATGPLNDYAPVVVYRGEDGKLWAREEAEFMDGRFVRVSAPGATAQDGESRITKDWCLRMAQHEAETGGEIGAGMPDHPLRAPEETPTPTIPAGMVAEVEALAQFLHDEGGFGDAMSDRTWPEHPDDTGQREGGWVKIVPSDVQAHFRDVARRWLLPRLAAAPKQAEQQGVEE